MITTPAYKRMFASKFSAIVRGDVVLYLVIAIYALAGANYVQHETGFSFDSYWAYANVWIKNYFVIFPIGLLGAGIIRIVLRLDQRRKLAMRHMFSAERMACFCAGTLLMCALLPFQATFTSVKNAISANGFQFDRVQADIDKIIHFNVDPWQWLYAVADSRIFLYIVEVNYMFVWFVLCFGLLYWIVVSPKTSGFRTRYVVTFILTWVILGNVMAGFYISAGPAYFGHVTGDYERFGEMIELLRRNEGHFNAAIKYQDYLWLLRENDVSGLASGISAFPSVHVGLTMMNALFVLELNRRLGIAFLVYTAFIVMSSVYLAWHYAIDGYVSIAVVLVLYGATRWLETWNPEVFGRRVGQGTPGVLQGESNLGT